MNAAERQDAMDRARRGDQEALGRLLGSFRPYLRVVARGLRKGRLPGRVDDSDLVQDALLEAHRRFADFRGTTVAELVAWLRQVVASAAVRSLRAHLGAGKRDQAREQPVEAFAGLLEDPGSSPSDRAVRREQADRTAEALGRLPEEMQQVLLGRYLDELPTRPSPNSWGAARRRCA